MLLGKPLQLRASGGRPVLVENLAYDTCRIEAGEASEIDCSLGVSDTLENTALARAQRWDMARSAQVGRNSGWIDGNLDRARPVLGADPRCHPESRRGVDAHSESSPVLLRIVLALLGKLKLVSAVAGKSEADPSACFPYHEVDQLRRDELSGADQVAFVLAILVVGDEDELARLDVSYCLLDSSKLHCVASARVKRAYRFMYGAASPRTYFPMTSVSTCTLVPRSRSSSAVFFNV